MKGITYGRILLWDMISIIKSKIGKIPKDHIVSSSVMVHLCHIIWENGMSMMKIEERGKI